MKERDVLKKDDEWLVKEGSRTVDRAPTKSEAVKKAADGARKAPEAITVKIHKEDGKIQEERTYPRSADPRKSKG
jgi:hypothetical protein